MKQLLLLCCWILAGADSYSQNNAIVPGALWPDQHGHHIQAHGGGVVNLAGVYYWYGEERTPGLDTNFRFVSCYSSKDLIHWKFRGDVARLADPEQLGHGWILERPKVYYIRSTRQYIMYFHLDSRDYKYAHVGIAVSKHPTGPFRYFKSFRPLGHESRDIGQFIDDDGTNYLIFEDRALGFHIVRLAPDGLSIDKEMSLVRAPMEGGAIVHYKGLYYSIGSALTGWKPNPNKYATAPGLEGPWTDFKDVAPPATDTWQSQSTLLLKISGSKDTTVIFMGDQWRPKELWNSRYLWMPLDIGDGKLSLPEPKPWIIDVHTGQWHFR